LHLHIIENGHVVYRARRKHVIVRAWPRSSTIPALVDPHFNKWALAQLRLHKPFRTIDELSSPSINDVFSSHLAHGGFPHLASHENDDATDSDLDSQPELGTVMEAHTLDGLLRQDDYQQIMESGRFAHDSIPLLGARELDLIHVWPHSWQGSDFNTLLTWLSTTKNSTDIPPPTLPPIPLQSLSDMQRHAFNIIHSHTFGSSLSEQLLMIVVGTAGTGKSYLINAIRQLFNEQDAASCLKITAPTGIAAAGIYGCTIFSLLPLLNENIGRERLLRLQISMADVKLLIIDEYSFLSAATFDSLNRQLQKIFPQATRPFGGINIVLCGDPAQLPPVHAQPVYAFRGPSRHVAARFHLFNCVVVLDQPFRQIGDDPEQIQFRSLLTHVANCEAHEDDWLWLQTRRACCLSSEENASFDDSKYIVSTNQLRNQINYDKLASFSPILKVDNNNNSLPQSTEIELDGDCLELNDTPLYAIGVQVMLTANLWTEAGLVNGASGVVEAILKSVEGEDAYILLVSFPMYRGPALSPLHPTVVPITQIRSGSTKGIPLTLA